MVKYINVHRVRFCVSRGQLLFFFYQVLSLLNIQPHYRLSSFVVCVWLFIGCKWMELESFSFIENYQFSLECLVSMSFFLFTYAQKCATKCQIKFCQWTWFVTGNLISMKKEKQKAPSKSKFGTISKTIFCKRHFESSQRFSN